jgi:hypothetical protein
MDHGIPTWEQALERLLDLEAGLIEGCHAGAATPG